MSEGILLVPEVSTIYGNPHWSINVTKLVPLLCTAEEIEDGPNDGVSNRYLDSILLYDDICTVDDDIFGSDDILSHGLSLGPVFGISEGNDDGETNSMFDGTLLGPEVGTVDGDPLGYINVTNLGLPLSTSESIENGTNDALLDGNLDGIIIDGELYLNLRPITCIFTGSFS